MRDSIWVWNLLSFLLIRFSLHVTRFSFHISRLEREPFDYGWSAIGSSSSHTNSQPRLTEYRTIFNFFFSLSPNSPWWEELEEVEWLLEILLLLACSLSSPNQVRPFTCRFNSGQQKRRNLSLYVSLFRRHHRAVERTTPPGPGLIIENASCVHKQTKKPFSERLKFTVLVDCTVFSSRHRPEHSLSSLRKQQMRKELREQRYMKSRSNSFTYRKSIYDTNVVLLIYALGRF